MTKLFFLLPRASIFIDSYSISQLSKEKILVLWLDSKIEGDIVTKGWDEENVEDITENLNKLCGYHLVTFGDWATRKTC